MKFSAKLKTLTKVQDFPIDPMANKTSKSHLKIDPKKHTAMINQE